MAQPEVVSLGDLTLDFPTTAVSFAQSKPVARALERAGDHLTNIAERTVYICTGKMARASDYKKPRA